MYKKNVSYTIILMAFCLPFVFVTTGCKKTWSTGTPSNTPTPTIKVVDVNKLQSDAEKGNTGGNALVPVTTLFPNHRVGTLTPTPTELPTPIPTATPDPASFYTPTPTVPPTPTFTPTPTPKPTNTPRPTRFATPTFTPTAEPTPFPTEGTIIYVPVSQTPTPKAR